MEKRYLRLDDILEVVAYLVSTARNVVGGPAERASVMFLDSAVRLISIALDDAGDEPPAILQQLAVEIGARREFLSLDASVYAESLDDLIRIIARDMMTCTQTEGKSDEPLQT